VELITLRLDEEILNAFKHFEEWTALSIIADALKLTPPTVEKMCWNLTGKSLVLWKPGNGREQLFRYNAGYGNKKETDLLPEINKLLGRDYYITGETALFMHGLTDYAMYQGVIEIALPKNKYSELAGKLVENLNEYATILPNTIPKHCKNTVIDALGRGNVIVLRKAEHNPRRLKFHGDLNLPDMEIILEELELPDAELLEYILKAIDLNLKDNEFEKLCGRKHNLVYLKKYLERDKNIPINILNIIKEAERNVRGY